MKNPTAANPINLTGIDHLVLRVNDLGRAIEFYTKVLGCRLERGPGELGLAQLRAGASLIDLVSVDGPLGQAGGGQPDSQRQNLDHFCLFLDPWDEPTILEHLRRHAVRVSDVATRYGATGMGPSIYLQDPEGNTIELKGR